MAQDLKFYCNGKELKNYPITQDEYGKTSHLNCKYSSGVLQRPLDFGDMKVGYAHTLSDDCTLYSRGSDGGNWICVRPVHFPQYYIMYVHQNAHFSTTKGAVCKAGQPICKVAPSSENGGYAIHLHISGRENLKEFFIRELIFKQETYSVGQRFIFLDVMNIRDANGNDIGDVAKNAVGEIIEVSTYHDNYQWYKIKFLDFEGYVADTNLNEISAKEITKLDGTVPVIITPQPEPEPEEPQPEPEAPNDDSGTPTTPEPEPEPESPTEPEKPKPTLIELIIQYFTDLFSKLFKKSG